MTPLQSPSTGTNTIWGRFTVSFISFRNCLFFNDLEFVAPSFNITPSEICPILTSARHFDEAADSSRRVLVPALWGIIPKWHTGDKHHGLTTNNARMENLSTSKLYKPLLEQGKRCVIPIEGFYEWQTVNQSLKSNQRKVYFIYMPQGDDIKIALKSTWNSSTVNLMYLAGLFDVWHDAKGDSIFSFTVLTFESNEKLQWLHSRTPAILETQEQIETWLDYKKYPEELALGVIKQPTEIVWHQVSNSVNNGKNKSENFKKPLDGINSFFTFKKPKLS